MEIRLYSQQNPLVDHKYGALGANDCFGEESNDLLGLLIFNYGFFDLELRMFWEYFVGDGCVLHRRTSLSNKISSLSNSL